MKITLISDTHGKHDDITEDLVGGDLLLHSGDSMTSGYRESQLIEFCEWFDSIDNYKCKIFIAGNHCRLFENFPERALEIVSQYKSIVYLQDTGFEYEGVKIYGSPHTPFFYNWAFNVERESPEMIEIWNKVPQDTDILITHGPPFGHLDTVEFRRHMNLGCEVLARRIDEIKPKIHLFGHIHTGNGYKFNGNTHLFNASVLDEAYDYAYPPKNITWDKETNEVIWI